MYFEHLDVADTAALEAVYAIERQCFPVEEQDTPELIYNRAKVAPECFWIMREAPKGEVIGFLNGVPMAQEQYTEAVFTDISLYNAEGPWVMLISLDIAPKHQKQGLSEVFIKHMLQELKERKLYKGAVFIAKENLVPYYKTFGFQDDGISVCKHGGKAWHQMSMLF